MIISSKGFKHGTLEQLVFFHLSSLFDIKNGHFLKCYIFIDLSCGASTRYDMISLEQSQSVSECIFVRLAIRYSYQQKYSKRGLERQRLPQYS